MPFSAIISFTRFYLFAFFSYTYVGYADIRPRDYTATVVINHRNGWDHYCSTISWPCFYTLRCRVIYSTCWRSLEEENQVAISRKSVTVYQKDRNARFLSTSQICMEKSYQHLRMFGRPLLFFFGRRNREGWLIRNRFHSCVLKVLHQIFIATQLALLESSIGGIRK